MGYRWVKGNVPVSYVISIRCGNLKLDLKTWPIWCPGWQDPELHNGLTETGMGINENSMEWFYMEFTTHTENRMGYLKANCLSADGKVHEGLEV